MILTIYLPSIYSIIFASANANACNSPFVTSGEAKTRERSLPDGLIDDDVRVDL
jgi:hypothetical protein